jgi:hypothetical protein
MNDQHSKHAGASRVGSATTTPSQKFQSLEKRTAKSSNGWKFFGVFFLLFSIFSSAAHALEAGFFKQFVIVDRGSGNEYFGNSIGENFNNANLGTWTRGDRVFLNGAEANTWARKDWSRVVEWTKFYYRIGGGSFTAINLDNRGANGNDDKWDQTTQEILLTGRSPGTYDFEVYFEGQGRQTWHSFTWLFYDNATPDYKATFTINAVNNPSSQSATAASSSSISLGWDKNEQNHDVMIVRKTSVQSWTEPTQGQSYSVGNSIGNGVVVYKGNATSATASDLSPSTAYDFKFYSVNYDYYSAGVTDSATTDAAASPTITLASGSSAFGNVTVNKTSSELSYTWSGTTLSGAVTVTAPSGFEISKTSGSGFASSLTFTPSSGTIAENTVYVRFKPTAVSSYSGNITHAGGGATSKTRAVSGTGTAPVDPASFSVSGGDRQNTLTFSLGTDSKPVVIVYDTDNTFSAPSGAPASVGQAFAGGTVVYNGSTSPQTHSGLNAGVQYYYKAFSYDSTGNFYSSGLTDDATTTAPQYGLRDDGGVNLPTLTYWYTGAGESDLTEKGSEFSGKNLGNITALYLKDATIKTFKNGAGDVTGTTFLYKLWEDGDSEPASYTERSVGFSSNDGDGNQTWSDFGAEIGLFSGLGENYGDYNLKILFTVSGSGVYGDTNSGPFTATFTYPLSAPSSQASSLGVNNERQTQMGVAWTSGNGSRRIVVARAGSAVNFTPADGTDYTHNTSFSAAADAGSGNKVVYDGTESSFTLTGLSADTTYHLKVFEYNGTGANTKYLTASAPTASGKTLGNPTSINVSRDGIYPATTVDISWTENNDKNVMVARSTATSPSGTPTAGVNYNAGQSFGDWTVVARSDDDGSLEVTGLVPGQAYLFKLWSENNGYYSAGSTPVGVTNDVPKGRNYQDSATPYVSVGTVYVGDNVVVGAKTYGDVAASSGSAAGWYAVIKADNGNLASGASEGATGGSGSSEDKTATTPRFSSAGTWYWGMRVDYGATYGDWYYLSDQDNWADLDADGNTSTLTIEVTELADPDSPTATKDALQPASEIDLAWTPVNGKRVIIARTTDNVFGTPVSGSDIVYADGDSIPGGGEVIYSGFGSSYSDEGLSDNQTYYYKFYSENYGYYSDGATATATTDPQAGPDAPSVSAATNVSYLTFHANWSPAVGATNYYLTVDDNSDFSSPLAGYDSLLVGNVTTYGVTVPRVGIYYYTLTAQNASGTSGNSSTITVYTATAQGRNAGGAAEPSITSGTIYVGDKVTVSVDTWGTISGAEGRGRAVYRKANADINGGSYGPWFGFDDDNLTTITNIQFSSDGTWYWGVQMDYGATYGTNFWMVKDTAEWTDLQYAGTNSELSVSVSALGNPSSITASLLETDLQGSIVLSWSKWEGRDVMVVRSTDASFFTPAGGTTYNSGQNVGSDVVVYRGNATTITNSGLSSSQTYYYKLYSENWSYYSSGTVTGAITTAGEPAAAPTVGAATLVTTTSFQANWSASQDANSYRLDVSSSSDFATRLAGYDDRTVNALYQAVTGLTPGSTYYYRVRAYNANGASGNSGTNSVTLPASMSTTLAEAGVSDTTVALSVTQGAQYDEYYSDDGGQTWTKQGTVTAASSTLEVTLDEGLASKRLFKTVPVGANPATDESSPVVGVVKPSIQPGFQMMAPPLLSDRQLHGTFGEQLADGLTAGNSTTGDEVWVLDGGSWRTFYLNSNDGSWYEGGSAANFTLGEGQGFYLYRKTASATTSRFTGQAGNTANTRITSTVNSGWNIIGPSQGKTLSFSDVASGVTSPTSAFSEDSADLIVIDEGGGNWRRIMKYGSGGQWLDLKSFTLSPTVSVEPGQAIYYFRTGGSTTATY